MTRTIRDEIAGALAGMPFLPGRAASIRVGGQIAGILGEAHPRVREQCDLPVPTVCLAEFDLDLLVAGGQRVPMIRSISRYPGVSQDLAIVVDQAVPAEQVGQLIRRAGGALLARVDLIDVYQGSPIPAGQKSLAFSLFFQAPDRTLTDKEVQGYHQRIVKVLGKELGATLRA